MTLNELEIADLLTEQKFFDFDREVTVARSPGRLDLMGGNVDYTGGIVLQSTVREGVWAAVQLRQDPMVHLRNPGAANFGWQPDLSLHLDDLNRADSLRQLCCHSEATRWATYVGGALHLLRQRGLGFTTCGADIYIYSNLPPNKGVSSSAALEIAVLKAASAACGSPLTGHALAKAGQWVENEIANSACGIMDQAAVVYGQEDTLLPLLCQPLHVYPTLPLPAGVKVWGIDSMTTRSTVSTEYEQARAAAFMAYTILCRQRDLHLTLDDAGAVPRWKDPLWNGYLSNLEPSIFRAGYEASLPEALSGAEFLQNYAHHADPFTTVRAGSIYPVRAAARYAIEENERIQQLTSIFRNWSTQPPDPEELGELMSRSHNAYRECGLGSDRCDDLVEMVRRAGPNAGLYGARMTGGGGGGTVAVLGADHGAQALSEIVREFGQPYGQTPHVFEGSSAGADSFHGEGFRHFAMQAR